jgi:hypothetical protein
MSGLMDLILSVEKVKLEQFVIKRLADEARFCTEPLQPQSICEPWYQESIKFDNSFPVIAY